MDSVGTVLGGAGFVEDIGAKLAMKKAQYAWDNGLPVLDLAREAEELEGTGSLLDRWAAGFASAVTSATISACSKARWRASSVKSCCSGRQ